MSETNNKRKLIKITIVNDINNLLFLEFRSENDEETSEFEDEILDDGTLIIAVASACCYVALHTQLSFCYQCRKDTTLTTNTTHLERCVKTLNIS